jgi:hypothetical protein
MEEINILVNTVTSEDIGNATSLYITSLGVIVFLFGFIFNDSKYDKHRLNFLYVMFFWLISSVISISSTFFNAGNIKFMILFISFLAYLLGLIKTFLIFNSIYQLNIFKTKIKQNEKVFQKKYFLTSIEEIDSIIDKQHGNGFLANNLNSTHKCNTPT